MTGFVLAMFVLPGAIIALALILARGARLPTGPGAATADGPGTSAGS